jgi:hypothetical protein
MFVDVVDRFIQIKSRIPSFLSGRISNGDLGSCPGMQKAFSVRQRTEHIMQNLDVATEAGALEALEGGLKGIEFDEFFETTTSFDPSEFVMRRC